MSSKAQPAATVDAIAVIEMAGFPGYCLIDSGGGRKLERFGGIVVDRPEPQALWRPGLEPARWQAADAVFAGSDDDEAGKWRQARPIPESWPVAVDDVTLNCRLSGFRHLGLFPEQLPHWQWMTAAIGRMRPLLGAEKPRVLNLFAYTGAASLIAARAGAEVVHVDASRKAVSWARENQLASGLEQAPLRWIVDDARKFVAREVRRGRTYHVVLVDPPKFGRGPGGEVWELFEHLAPLMGDCIGLLDRRTSCLALTVYAIRASALAFGQMTAELLAGSHRSLDAGALEVGELAIREQSGRACVPTSLYTRWTSHG